MDEGDRTPMNRMPRRSHFLDVATAIGRMGECSRTKVGAIIVARDRIWATGRNGTEPGSPLSCLTGDCPRGKYTKASVPSRTPFEGEYACIATHAEANAYEQFVEVVAGLTDRPDAWFKEQGWASRIPLPNFSPVMYVNHTPCAGCCGMLEYAGLEADYPNAAIVDM